MCVFMNIDNFFLFLKKKSNIGMILSFYAATPFKECTLIFPFFYGNHKSF